MNPRIIIVPMSNPIDNSTSHNGISSMPTRRNMIIGEKNGINDVIVIIFEFGDVVPYTAMKKAIIIKNIIGNNRCWTSSTRLTSDPSIAAIVAYRK